MVNPWVEMSGMNMARAPLRTLVSLTLLLTMVGVLAGTGIASATGQRASTRNKLFVVTTVSPITSIVSSVAGDLAEVHGLIPEGSDSHTFEPPPSAAETLAKADVVFVNGLKLEEPTRDLAGDNLKSGAEIVELGTKTIPRSAYVYDFSFPKEGGKPNPHLWTNPPYARGYARIAADTFERLDPAHALEYEANYDAFAAEVDGLDQAMKSASESMTAEQRELLTYHDAYAYFARHYGWEVVGAVQISSFEDPSPREVGRLISQVKKLGVPAIFGSEVFPSPVLGQIGKEAGVRYVDKLRDDDLPGEPGDAQHSWLGLMKLDFVTMVKNLGGDTAALEAVRVTSTARDKADYPQ
jgi:ABC-type Zn uptake system ZnuABC Zn-binding protein ZnuA